jgi:hypothetical protein
MGFRVGGAPDGFDIDNNGAVSLTAISDCAGSCGTAGQVLSSTGTALQWVAGGGGSGTVTSITAGSGLTGGTITTSGTIALNTSCVVRPSTFTTAGQVLVATGNGTYCALDPGSSGTFLRSNGTALQWANPTITGVGQIFTSNPTSGSVVTFDTLRYWFTGSVYQVQKAGSGTAVLSYVYSSCRSGAETTPVGASEVAIDTVNWVTISPTMNAEPWVTNATLFYCLGSIRWAYCFTGMRMDVGGSPTNQISIQRIK